MHRLEELSISRFWTGQTDKLSAIKMIRKEGLESHQILFVGDDIPDLDVIENVGLFVAVRNAHKVVKNKAHYITQKSGGCGAVREVCDLIEYSYENRN